MVCVHGEDVQLLTSEPSRYILTLVMLLSLSDAVAVTIICWLVSGFVGKCETETVGGVPSETVKTSDNGALICEAVSVQFM